MDKVSPSNLYIMQARLCRDPWYNFESIFLLKERMTCNGIAIPECPKNGFKTCNLEINKDNNQFKKRKILNTVIF